MSNKSYSLTYRGELCGLVTTGKTIAFTTRHVEQKPSSLYLIDGESHKLTTVPLDCVAQSLFHAESQYWIGDVDASLYSVDEESKTVSEHKLKIESPIVAFCTLSNSRLGLASGSELLIVSASKKAKVYANVRTRQ